jgi:cold shock CspA family protein
MLGRVLKRAASGYGFATSDDGYGDIYLPAKLLANHPDIGVGDAVAFDVSEDRGSGRRFAKNLRLDSATPPKLKYRGRISGNPYHRGFCFVQNASGVDAFLHVTVIERAGLRLSAGDQVIYELAETEVTPGERPLVSKVELPSASRADRRKAA